MLVSEDSIFLAILFSLVAHKKLNPEQCKKKSIKIAKLSTAKQKNIPLEFLPYSLHVIDNAALMNSYLIFCFLLGVQCVALGLIYCILCKPCSEDRIISFLVGFSTMLITKASECFININLFLK